MFGKINNFESREIPHSTDPNDNLNFRKISDPLTKEENVHFTEIADIRAREITPVPTDETFIGHKENSIIELFS